MLLSIFIFLVLFSLVLIIGGYYIEAPVMQIAGTGVLFVTGLLLMFSSVEYVSGEDTSEYYVYGNNFTDYHWDQYHIGDEPSFNSSDDAVFLFHTEENTTHVYSTWDEDSILGVNSRHTVAFLLLVSALLIFVSVLSHLRDGRNIDDE